MSRENVIELLKNYRSYKYSVSRYERHRNVPAAGVANYSGMPGGSGAQEFFFAPNGRMADMGNTSLQDRMDYNMYAEAVEDIEGGLDTLTDEEQSVIKLKWMDQLTLQEIADRKKLSICTIKSRHKSALQRLDVCFRFIKPPEIEEITNKGSQHMHHAEKSSPTNLY